ncbi:1,4-dihydroxy-2-naphthoate polyprenyltransferase [Bradymonadaceae bacterium TMQ3]|uniref:1,4-dihydroxy-2-naphthoate octaprenyltransferase n=1 Tax=Lujinxingia sediminis TaxID=2480984 RepID=A0ABY0CY63_9DELT|nr:1,4-dihydroxy-2-naphthoate polyprenyltransferase [Lujinxingia sediminis]RDV39138.1 1,4-dihydroxy-2-naphthoate polyprenyltransferase [Bradymonadaceae bacterium TMQ3]RVU48817.1 1,4-dihydroxy-2-naphthoate polyprenyltransferase [Lujinxingia sediminis]TXC78110.1 1,4-dihydroxy-2-naphthoate polyprenyltransferase [Bradymonadales bacterium TMQ1]
MTSSSPSRLQSWILASRPKTLAAAAVPVLVGSAVAYGQDVFAPGPAIAALVGAGLIQIGTNFANDYFDAKSGADNENRLGPTRAVQAGLLTPNAMKWATALTFLAAALVGLYLIGVGGWPILIIGIASILSGIAYTGGPYPLGYNGLGDLFVFLFFGLIAVTATHYVQALSFSPEALVASIPIGLLSTAILIVNNYRDVDTDRVAGKNTLAVRLGKAVTRKQYAGVVLAAYLVPVIQIAAGLSQIWVLLPLLSLPLAIKCIRALGALEGSALNALLARTAGLLTVFGVLYAIGFAL